MKKFITVIYLAVLFSITACAEKTKASACSTDGTKELVQSQIKKTIIESKEFEKFSDGLLVASNKVGYTKFVNGLQIELQDIRTENLDANTTLKNCRSTVSITIPQGTIDEAEDAKQLLTQQNIESQLSRLFSDKTHIFDAIIDENHLRKVGVSGFSYQLSFQAQKTDDGNSTFAAIGDLSPVNQVLALISLMQQIKPQLLNQIKEEEEKGNIYARENYESAKLQNKQHRNELNMLWNNLDDVVKSALLNEQRD